MRGVAGLRVALEYLHGVASNNYGGALRSWRHRVAYPCCTGSGEESLYVAVSLFYLCLFDLILRVLSAFHTYTTVSWL